MLATAVLGFVLALQQPGIQQPGMMAPPPGARSSFTELCRSIRTFIAEGKFSEAEVAWAKLPKKSVSFGWDDSNLPPTERSAFAEFRDLALEAARSEIRGLKLAMGPSPDILFDFVKDQAGTEISPGAASGLRVYIGLKQAQGGGPISKTDAYLAVARAVGVYYGVPDNPLPGTAMSSPREAAGVFGLNRAEQTIVFNNLRYVEQLRQWIAAKKVVPFTEPKAELLTASAEFGDVLQGTSPKLTLKLKNTGSAALDFRVTPDCNCFSPMPPGTVAPGATAQITSDIRTLQFTGIQSKRLILYTNDPATPIIEIPVKFRVVPAFRLYRPDGENVVVSDSGGTFEIFLIPGPNIDIQPASAELLGVEGKVTMAPWSGEIPDYVMQEPKRPRKGYKFTVKIAGSVPPGRPSGMLQVKTNNFQFSTVTYTLYVQKGIVALPDQVFFGDISGTQDAYTIVSRPGIPFSITKITSDNPNVTASFTMIKGGYDYRIKVRHDGKGPRGDLAAAIKVFTNDPKQAPIEISVGGYVK